MSSQSPKTIACVLFSNVEEKLISLSLPEFSPSNKGVIFKIFSPIFYIHAQRIFFLYCLTKTHFRNFGGNFMSKIIPSTKCLTKSLYIFKKCYLFPKTPNLNFQSNILVTNNRYHVTLLVKIHDYY